ncbi:MAG: hypothetical protein PVF58_19345 [Candidatus Methanofastidiosia archaeon]|jgi:hypothetical protein
MPLTVEEILRKNNLYAKSVLFFKALSQELSDHHIKTKVEKKIPTPELADQKPDFIILDKAEEKVTTIIEHKSSITQEKKYVIRDISKIYKKYSKVIYNDLIQIPDIVYAYPITCREVINEIKDDINFNICLWEFDLNLERGKLIFSETLNSISDDRVRDLSRNESFIDFDISSFSRYRFIRHDPHPTYTSYYLWNVVFRIFESIEHYDKETIHVNYNDIVRESKTFFPPWVEDPDLDQITKSRINKALVFLHKLKVIKWNKQDREIEIFHKKLTRVGEISSYFCRNWVRIEEGKEEREKGDKSQLSLDEYITKSG